MKFGQRHSIRGDLTPKEMGRGTGLGLAIVREIAEHHKGKSWVESSAEGRTTFYFSIDKNL